MSTGTKKRGGFWKAIGWFLAICVVLELGLRLFGYGSFTNYRPMTGCCGCRNPDARLPW